MERTPARVEYARVELIGGGIAVGIGALLAAMAIATGDQDPHGGGLPMFLGLALLGPGVLLVLSGYGYRQGWRDHWVLRLAALLFPAALVLSLFL